MDLVLRLGAGLLDRTGLDDGQQALRVTARTGAGRRGRDRGRRRPSGCGTSAAGGRRRGGTTVPAAVAAASTRERGLALARALEQVRGDTTDVLGDRVAGVGRGSRRFGRGLFVARGRVVGRDGRGLLTIFTFDRQAEGLAALLATAQQVFGDIGHASASFASRADPRCRRPCGRARSEPP